MAISQTYEILAGTTSFTWPVPTGGTLYSINSPGDELDTTNPNGTWGLNDKDHNGQLVGAARVLFVNNPNDQSDDTYEDYNITIKYKSTVETPDFPDIKMAEGSTKAFTFALPPGVHIDRILIAQQIDKDKAIISVLNDVLTVTVPQGAVDINDRIELEVITTDGKSQNVNLGVVNGPDLPPAIFLTEGHQDVTHTFTFNELNGWKITEVYLAQQVDTNLAVVTHDDGSVTVTIKGDSIDKNERVELEFTLTKDDLEVRRDTNLELENIEDDGPGPDPDPTVPDFTMPTFSNLHYMRAGTDVITVKGHAHGDRIIGNAEDNRLFGNGSNDIINGKAGDDRIFGGDGQNRLIGGSGDDVFIIESSGNTIKGGSGADRIIFKEEGLNQVRGFDADDGDTLVFQNGLNHKIYETDDGHLLVETWFGNNAKHHVEFDMAA